jgi:lipoprotein signal peptidase
VLSLVLVLTYRTPIVAYSLGAAVGGMSSNIADSSNGIVWNMIPLPGMLGYTINVADVCIIVGSLVAAVSVAIQSWQMCRQKTCIHPTEGVCSSQ